MGLYRLRTQIALFLLVVIIGNGLLELGFLSLRAMRREVMALALAESAPARPHALLLCDMPGEDLLLAAAPPKATASCCDGPEDEATASACGCPHCGDRCAAGAFCTCGESGPRERLEGVCITMPRCHPTNPALPPGLPASVGFQFLIHEFPARVPIAGSVPAPKRPDQAARFADFSGCPPDPPPRLAA
jgi:hypothetical protein